MIVSRAAFVKLCGAAIVGGSLPRWALPGDSLAGSAQTAPVETGASRFRPHIGSLFTIDSTGQRVRLSTIVETAVSPDIEQFALNHEAHRKYVLALTSPLFVIGAGAMWMRVVR